MTYYEQLDAVTPEYGVSIQALNKQIALLRGAMRTLARARVPLGDVVEAVRRSYTRAAIDAAKGNRSRAALAAGVHRNTLLRIAGPRLHRKPVNAILAEQHYQRGA